MKQVLFESKINDRMSLIIPSLSMAEEIFALIDADRDHLRPWLPWVDDVVTAEDTRKNLIERIESFNQKEQAAFYGTLDGEVVASVGFVAIKDGVGEIGYWLLSPHLGKGLATVYVEACIKYGFNTLGLQKIVIKCAEGNSRSAAIPERLNFVKSTETGVERFRNGEIHPTIIYTLDKKD